MGLVTLDRDGRIDSCVGRLVDWLQPGQRATKVLPFLTGLDGILNDIIDGRMPSFTLPRVGWGDSAYGEKVLSLEIVPSDESKSLLILVRDESELARLERDVLQQRNELALANSKLAEAKERAESLLREKSSFLATISHDLKTPLQVIMGNAEILREDLSADERDAFLQDVLDNGRFLQAMISDLLDASALDADRLTLTEERVVVRNLLEQVISTARRLPEGDNRRFELCLDDESRAILADPMRLRRLLLNIVSNAVKFTEDKGIIALRAQRTDAGCLLIAVEDDGCGVDPKLVDRIFDPFTMGESSDGTGLGLYIAKGLAELHGADLSISSQLDHGTKVELRLPQSRSLS